MKIKIISNEAKWTISHLSIMQMRQALLEADSEGGGEGDAALDPIQSPHLSTNHKKAQTQHQDVSCPHCSFYAWLSGRQLKRCFSSCPGNKEAG